MTPPDEVERLAGRYFWLAEIRGRLAGHQQWLGEHWAALAERDWQAALGTAEEAGGRSPSGRTPEPVPRPSTAARGRSHTTGG
jgi:hypothetical protein